MISALLTLVKLLFPQSKQDLISDIVKESDVSGGDALKSLFVRNDQSREGDYSDRVVKQLCG